MFLISSRSLTYTYKRSLESKEFIRCPCMTKQLILLKMVHFLRILTAISISLFNSRLTMKINHDLILIYIYIYSYIQIQNRRNSKIFHHHHNSKYFSIYNQIWEHKIRDSGMRYPGKWCIKKLCISMNYYKW